MEARWDGLSDDDVFDAAIAGTEDFDEVTLATLTGLLRAYLDIYREEELEEVFPELEFRHRIAGSRTFEAGGKIDGLGRSRSGHLVLIEHKTCSDSLEPDSDYWLRLRANPQILQYVTAARNEGWDVTHVLYDVTRKPTIRPRQIPELDADGLKTVRDDVTGERAVTKQGTPRQSAGPGLTLVTREESGEEFARRLRDDALSRPGFYFARQEVPVLEQDLEEFRESQVQISRMILDRRRQERRLAEGIPRERAWPRHVNGILCPHCEYAGFCLSGASPWARDGVPIPGFELGPIHSELEGTAE
jgi:hypothetical protein